MIFVLVQVSYARQVFFEVKSDHLELTQTVLLEHVHSNQMDQLDSKISPAERFVNPKDIQLLNGKYAVAINQFRNLTGFSLLKEECRGHCVFELDLYIKDSSKIDDILLLYSTNQITQRDTPYFPSLKKAKRNRWFRFNIWMFDYKPLLGQGPDLQISNPYEFTIEDTKSPLSPRARRKFKILEGLSSQQDVYIHAL